MSGYLTNLVERTIGRSPVVTPHPSAAYGPPAPPPEAPPEIDDGRPDAEPPETIPASKAQRAQLPRREGSPKRGPMPLEADQSASEPTLLPLITAAPRALVPWLWPEKPSHGGRRVAPPEPQRISPDATRPRAEQEDRDDSSSSAKVAEPSSLVQRLTASRQFESRDGVNVPVEPAPDEGAAANSAPANSVSRRESESTAERRGPTERPIVRVTIGRIDVRASVQSLPAQPRPTLVPRPRLSLEEYLKSRSGGRR